MIPGYYWYVQEGFENKIVEVYDTYRHFAGAPEPRLEVQFPGTDYTEPVVESKGKFYGPLFFPERLRDPQLDENMTELVMSWVTALLKDPTCEVTIAQDLSLKQEQEPDHDKFVTGAKRTVTIQINGDKSGTSGR